MTKVIMFTMLSITMVLLMLVSSAKPANNNINIKKTSGGLANAMKQSEFHLTCTALFDGNPSPPPSSGREEDEGEEARRRSVQKPKKGKGRKKRSPYSRVQLLCDIDNPEGQEIVRRSVSKKKEVKEFKGRDHEDEHHSSSPPTFHDE